MNLDELIDARKTNAQDPMLKLLLDIQKLDAKRERNLYRLNDKIAKLDQAAQSGNSESEDVRSWLYGFRSEVGAALRVRREQFGGELADGLTALGIKLKGQYPRLYGGLFTFVMNADKGRCKVWYGPEQEQLAETTLDAKSVLDVVLKTGRKLGSGLEPAEIFVRLQRAWQHARFDRLQGPLSLQTLLPHMAFAVQSNRFLADPRRESYRSYGRADFSYDLYRVQRLDATTATPFRLSVATRQQTQKRSDYLWVPSREDTEAGNLFSTIEM